MSPLQQKALELISRGAYYPDFIREEDGWHAVWCSALGDENPWIDEYVRKLVGSTLDAHAENRTHESIHDAWIAALKSKTGLVLYPEEECVAFAAEVKRWNRNAIEDLESRGKIGFRLKSIANSFYLEANIVSKRAELVELGRAVAYFPAIRNMRRAADDLCMRVELSRSEAESFISRGERDLKKAGYDVVSCDFIAEIAAEATLESPEIAEGPADSQEASLHAKIEIKVAGHKATIDEIRFLLDQGSSLVYFRDRWIEVDRDLLREALRVLERYENKALSRNEALMFACGASGMLRLQMRRLQARGWIRGLLNELSNRGWEGVGLEEKIEGLNAKLHGYQARGIAWMKFLTDNGFGALLADDMGLGKTLQTIGWIMATRDARGKAPVLIVVPLTLIANWKHELQNFAPKLSLLVHHGDNRGKALTLKRKAGEVDVVITSYSLIVKDYKAIADVEWSAMVLDEAQAIKNPDTQISRAVRSLGVRNRIALTGTPLENSVVDIWSIEDFLNPGFLGTIAEFKERYEKPIAEEEKSTAASRLKRALEPFVLRRLKSEKEIAAELGQKREIKEYCMLSNRQRNEYVAALEDYRAGEKRQGDVFSLISRLKHICDGEGKFERLSQLIEEIRDAGESVLIFTQYVEAGRKICAFLDKRFGVKPFFLHGELSTKERQNQIDAFNQTDAGVFVLSLKTGGYGLNLTKANHVVHFDRWWNPAVENQATDRAHRIGQTKTVFVHVFITEGTLEEKVDLMLERKERIAGTLVGSGESFLSKLSLHELEEVVSLS